MSCQWLSVHVKNFVTSFNKRDATKVIKIVVKHEPEQAVRATSGITMFKRNLPDAFIDPKSTHQIGEYSRRVSAAWKALSEEERDKFNELAKADTEAKQGASTESLPKDVDAAEVKRRT